MTLRNAFENMATEASVLEVARHLAAAGHVTHGELASLQPGQTAVLAALTAPLRYRVCGFAATGDTDGYFRLTVDGAPVLSGRINAVEQSIVRTVPVPVPVAAGVRVLVEVRNDGGLTSTFEATLLGETR